MVSLSTRRSTSPPTTSRKTRQSTRCIDIAKSHVSGKKQPFDFDNITGKIVRSHQVKLSSYLGTLAREKVSILYEHWKLVPSCTKKIIWLDVMEKFEINNSSALKARVLQSVGKKWRDFKSSLTTNYVFGEMKDKNPCEMYGIDKSEWEEFKKTRLDPSWEEKRKKAKETAKKNDAPHVLSRGGYALLDERIMENKIKKRREEALKFGVDSVVHTPSPPCQERFKLARTKKSGDITSDAAREIAKRIDELEADDSFIVEGRTNILTAAIGRPEHPGRVRGVGSGVGIREYFGSQSRGSVSSITPDLLDQLTSTITEKVKKEMAEQNRLEQMRAEQMRTEMEHMAEKIRQDVTQKLLRQFAQPVEVTIPPAEVDPNHSRSGKESCVGPDIPCRDIPHIPARSTPTRVNDRCELYVDDGSTHRLVALGTVYEGGSTIHGVPLLTDHFRVVVQDIQDGAARVPVPTKEVITVEQALGGFIAWPKRLVLTVKPMSLVDRDNEQPKKRACNVDNPVRELIKTSASLYGSPFRYSCDASIFGFENDGLIIHFKEVIDFVQGKTSLDISIVQLWIVFLKSLVVENRSDDVYGFFEPRSIQNMGSKKHASTLTSSILKHMHESTKQIYLGAYHHNKRHWQLFVIFPQEGTIMWFCSNNQKPDSNIRSLVQSVVTQFKVLDGTQVGKFKQKSVIWHFPKCNKQDEIWESGYYVMLWMWTIVRVGIKGDLKEMFSEEPFGADSIKEVQDQWSRYFIDIYDR